ncbi:MAG: sigma-54-dependent Fis family transcriptional regulator, partial [Bacteroidales bacterium]|nr:sigma-54-dependent Fis family transcriptional regulator [Bacteroidales bacterium]
DRSEDIYLLFRKFTSDFAQRYRMSRISLTHDAISMLKGYRWPGNIRQLKNFTESITALESVKAAPGMEKYEIDSVTLSRYIPKETGAIMPVSPASGGMSDSEKQMFVKAILDLKQEVDDLKRAVYGQGGARQEAPVLESHRAVQEPEEAEWQEPEEDRAPSWSAPQQEEDLSLVKAERDNILKALEKHGGNRKLAAAELGISERTLYRRIAKQ